MEVFTVLLYSQCSLLVVPGPPYIHFLYVSLDKHSSHAHKPMKEVNLVKLCFTANPVSHTSIKLYNYSIITLS